MKPGTLTSRRIWLPLLAIGLIVALASWDLKQAPGGRYDQQYQPTDTTPKKKKTEKKVRDLDEALEELERVDIEKEMQKAQEEIAKAMKEFDGEKIRLDIEKAIKSIDMGKIQREVEE